MAINPYTDYGLPEFASDSAEIVEPSTPQKEQGYTNGERVPPATANWIAWLSWLWLVWIDAITRGVNTWAIECWNFTNTYLEDNGWFSLAGTFTTAPATPSATMPYRFLRVTGAIGSNEAQYSGVPFHYFTMTTEAWVEWTQQVVSYGTSVDYEIETGLTFTSSTGVHRITVRKTEASANWFLYIQDASGTTSLNTGVPATAAQIYRMRLEYSGPNGNGTDARVRCYIDGVLVETVTDVNVPKNTAGMLWFRYFNTDAANAIGDFYLGPIARAA